MYNGDTEVYRVLQPGSAFGIYDIMHIGKGDISFPVPWASEESMSFLAAPEHYHQALDDAGFSVSKQNSRHRFAMDFFKAQREKTEAQSGQSPLGLHTLMQDTTTTKIKNMVQGIAASHIAPVEMIAYKPARYN